MPPSPPRRKKAAATPAKVRRPKRGEREVYKPDGDLADKPQPRLLQSSDTELRRQMTAKRKEIRAAKTAYSNAGSKVKTLQEELEALLEEADRRSALENDKQPSMV